MTVVVMQNRVPPAHIRGSSPYEKLALTVFVSPIPAPLLDLPFPDCCFCDRHNGRGLLFL